MFEGLALWLHWCPPCTWLPTHFFSKWRKEQGAQGDCFPSHFIYCETAACNTNINFLWLVLYDLWFLLPERTLQMYTADQWATIFEKSQPSLFCHTVSEGAEGMCCYGPLAQEKAESTADKPSTTVNIHSFTIFRDRQDTLSLCAQQLFA